jgi:hypothetical protein
VNGAAFLDLVAQIEAWEATWALTAASDADLNADMRTAPFYDIISDQRLQEPVRKLCRDLTPNHRKWLWSKIKTRLAALVTRGTPRQVDGRLQPGEWQIKIPAAPCGWLNANKSLDRNVASRLRSQWRHHVYATALGERKRLPQGLEYVKVDLQFQVKTYGLRDNANLGPTAKPIVDAFGPSRTYQVKDKWVHEPGLGVYVGDDPSHMAAGGAFLDWFDEEYKGPLDGIVWMRIIDLSPLQRPERP